MKNLDEILDSCRKEKKPKKSVRIPSPSRKNGRQRLYDAIANGSPLGTTPFGHWIVSQAAISSDWSRVDFVDLDLVAVERNVSYPPSTRFGGFPYEAKERVLVELEQLCDGEVVSWHYEQCDPGPNQSRTTELAVKLYLKP